MYGEKNITHHSEQTGDTTVDSKNYSLLKINTCIFVAFFLGSIDIKCEEEQDGTIIFYAIVPQAKINALNLVSEDGYRDGSPTHMLDFLQEEE